MKKGKSEKKKKDSLSQWQKVSEKPIENGKRYKIGGKTIDVIKHR